MNPFGLQLKSPKAQKLLEKGETKETTSLKSGKAKALFG